MAGPSWPVVSSAPPTGSRRLVVHRAEIAQLVEHATENRGVASSNLALGTTSGWADLQAEVAQLVEHHLAKVRVAGSNPVVRSERPPQVTCGVSSVEWPRGEATDCKSVYTGSNPVSTSGDWRSGSALP